MGCLYKNFKQTIKISSFERNCPICRLVLCPFFELNFWYVLTSSRCYITIFLYLVKSHLHPPIPLIRRCYDHSFIINEVSVFPFIQDLNYEEYQSDYLPPYLYFWVV